MSHNALADLASCI